MTASGPLSTRVRFVEAALFQFAERGFYGVSLDQVARKLGLTKQALIHHFKTKEGLYGAVLEGIAARLMESLDGHSDSGRDETFADALHRLYDHALEWPLDTQVLMRELLDNRRRAARAGTWYLRPFLDRLHDLLRQSPAWRTAGEAELAIHTYQLLGAINYFVVSLTTLENMYSVKHVNRLKQAFPGELRRNAEQAPVSVD